MEIGKIPHAVNKSSPLRILVVDDESLIRWSLSETLTDSGHLVSEAGDGETALRTLTDGERPFDVVLLDYHLPDSHDLGLLSQIRQVAPNTAVIMMTAFGTPEMSDAALCIGAYRVVPKPFEVHDIAALVLEAHASVTSSR
jgi:DNA-binding NtrC family response regulator